MWLRDGVSYELARGLGDAFVRPVGGAPSTWLAFGDWPHRLERADLPGWVRGPTSFGRILAVALLIASLYALFGTRAFRRAARLEQGVAANIVEPGVLAIGSERSHCDPALPLGPVVALAPRRSEGGYRDAPATTAKELIVGERSWLLAVARTATVEHYAMAFVVMLLGASCAVAALGHGVSLEW